MSLYSFWLWNKLRKLNADRWISQSLKQKPHFTEIVFSQVWVHPKTAYYSVYINMRYLIFEMELPEHSRMLLWHLPSKNTGVSSYQYSKYLHISHSLVNLRWKRLVASYTVTSHGTYKRTKWSGPVNMANSVNFGQSYEA